MERMRREIRRSRDILVIGPSDPTAIEVYELLRAQLTQLEDYGSDPTLYMEKPMQTWREYSRIPCEGVTAHLQEKNGVKVWQLSLYYISIDKLAPLTNLFSTLTTYRETAVLLCLDQDFLNTRPEPFRPLNGGTEPLYYFDLATFLGTLPGYAGLIYIFNSSPFLDVKLSESAVPPRAAFSVRILRTLLPIGKNFSDYDYIIPRNARILFKHNLSFNQIFK